MKIQAVIIFDDDEFAPLRRMQDAVNLAHNFFSDDEFRLFGVIFQRGQLITYVQLTKAREAVNEVMQRLGMETNPDASTLTEPERLRYRENLEEARETLSRWAQKLYQYI